MKCSNNAKRGVATLTLLSALISAPVLVWADDVENAIKEALDAYKNKDIAAAQESLDYAGQLLRQQKGGMLEKYLPAPLDGWKAEDASSAAAGAGFLGGGVTAERVYKKGDKRITVSMVTDSPMLQGVMMMFGNPMFATSDGGKMQRINGQKAIVKMQPSDSHGEIRMVINNTLVTVEGRADETELKAYAEKINVKGLAGN